MEEVLPPQTQEGAGFESTRVRQFTVFMENRVGRLQSLVRSYEETDGRIVALSIQNSADTALVRLICSDPDAAKEVLNKDGFSFTEQDLLVVQVPKRTQYPLILICAALLTAEINIHYAYTLLAAAGGGGIGVYVDGTALAAKLLVYEGV